MLFKQTSQTVLLKHLILVDTVTALIGKLRNGPSHGSSTVSYSPSELLQYQKRYHSYIWNLIIHVCKLPFSSHIKHINLENLKVWM